MELLAQDRVLTSSGTTANPVTRTGANTPWLAATIVFKVAAPPAQAQALAQARSVARTATSHIAEGATPISAAAAPVAAEQRVYAFTAITPKAANDAASLLFCPLPIITVGLS
jgi:hypothetical protein